MNLSSCLANWANLDDVNLFNSSNNRMIEYGRTKLCFMMYTIELASRLKDTTVTAYSVHPGIVKTKIFVDSSISSSMALKKSMTFVSDLFSKVSTLFNFCFELDVLELQLLKLAYFFYNFNFFHRKTSKRSSVC